MLGMAHVAFNIGLCSAITRKPPKTPIAIHVRITDSQRIAHVDKTVTVLRGEDPHVLVPVDMDRGTYFLQIAAPKFNCAAVDWLVFEPDLDRNINETLVQGKPKPTRPLLVLGTLPQSFQSADPTYLLFDKASVACGKPIVDPIPSEITTERDSDAFYASIQSTPAIMAKGPDSVTIALRLTTPHGDYHYIRIPMKYPEPWYGFPVVIKFNIREDELLYLPQEPIDTLLCPHFLKTSVG